LRSTRHSRLAQRKVEGVDMRKVPKVVRKPQVARQGGQAEKGKEGRNKALGKAIRAALLDVKKYMDAAGKPWAPVGTIVFVPEGKTAISGRLVLNKLGQQLKPEIIELMRQKVAEADEATEEARYNTSDPSEQATDNDIPF